ncbi:MAG TPA: anthrone oxygenase family protein [Terriglobales bacterium]|nr:anthrone oxygenase family protein [Terriglobales bacterium]
MLELSTFLSLAGYAVVVSQPLAYLVFLGPAQSALPAAAYIELRHGIDAAMNRRLPVIYLSTLAAVTLHLALSWNRGGGHLLLILMALLCLVADIALALRKNVPINQTIDSWSAADYPADWATYRARWFAAFRYRQIVMIAGFLSLLLGITA